MPGAPDISRLPAFLRTHHVFDLRENAERRLSGLIAAIGGSVATAQDQKPDFIPYRGLEPFEPTHADHMFGRDEDTQALLKVMSRGDQFVVVVGNSGSGKSSLVKAGLLPAVINGELDNSHEWLSAVITPGRTPLRSLATGLTAALAADAPEGFTHVVEETARLRNLLQGQAHVGRASAPFSELRAEADLGDVLAARKRQDGSPKRMLLVVDQLEELFNRDGTTGGGLDSEAERFLELLTQGVAFSDDLFVVATMRADRMGDALETPALADHIRESAFMITSPVAGDTLREIIERPAQLAGLSFEDGLVDLIVRTAAGQANVLPMLQFMLLRLWEDRNRATNSVGLREYEDVGGLEGAIAACAERAVQALSTKQVEQSRSVFRRLVGVSRDGTLHARRVPIAEFEDAQRPIVERLVSARLLVVDESEEVRIAHESLMHRWPRLELWIQEEKQALVELQTLRDAARMWDADERGLQHLARGRALTQYRTIAKAFASDIAEVERAYLSASRRRALQATLLVAAAAVVVVVAMGATTVSAFDATFSSQHEKASTAIAKYIDSAEFLAALAEGSLTALTDCSNDAGLTDAILKHNAEKTSMDAALAPLNLLEDVAAEARACNRERIKGPLNDFVNAYNDACYPPGTGDESTIRLRRVPRTWKSSTKALSKAVRECDEHLTQQLRLRKQASPGAQALAAVCGNVGTTESDEPAER